MASSFFSSLRALARVMGVPAKRGGCGGGPDDTPGGRPGNAAAVPEIVVQGADRVGNRAGGLKVDEVMDAVTAAGAVSLGGPVERGAHVAVLDGQSYQAAGPTRDVPCQRAAEAADADLPVRVVGDDLGGQAVIGCLAVGPGREVLDPPLESAHVQRPSASPPTEVVGAVGE
jgi:hypothetical protein